MAGKPSSHYTENRPQENKFALRTRAFHIREKCESAIGELPKTTDSYQCRKWAQQTETPNKQVGVYLLVHKSVWINLGISQTHPETHLKLMTSEEYGRMVHLSGRPTLYRRQPTQTRQRNDQRLNIATLTPPVPEFVSSLRAKRRSGNE